MPPARDERVENAGLAQRYHPVQAVSGPWTPFELPGFTPLQFIAPSPKKQPNDYAGFAYWSSPLRPNDYWGQQPKKKQRSHLCQCSTHCTPLRRVDLILAIHAFAAIRRSAH